MQAGQRRQGGKLGRVQQGRGRELQRSEAGLLHQAVEQRGGELHCAGSLEARQAQLAQQPWKVWRHAQQPQFEVPQLREVQRGCRKLRADVLRAHRKPQHGEAAARQQAQEGFKAQLRHCQVPVQCRASTRLLSARVKHMQLFHQPSHVCQQRVLGRQPAVGGARPQHKAPPQAGLSIKEVPPPLAHQRDRPAALGF